MSIKKYDEWVNESQSTDPILDTKEKIKAWLDAQSVTDYTINNNLTVDVTYSCSLEKGNIFKRIPVKFGKVGGAFSVFSPNLESLEGSPKQCSSFTCDDCPKLTSLKGAPEIVERMFSCENCTSLLSLEGAPKSTGEGFYCDKCTSLKNLKGAPQKVSIFSCCECTGLESFEGINDAMYGSFSFEFTPFDVFSVPLSRRLGTSATYQMFTEVPAHKDYQPYILQLVLLEKLDILIAEKFLDPDILKKYAARIFVKKHNL